jgi:hypothetical protein
MSNRAVSRAFVNYVFAAVAIPELLMLYLYYPDRYPFWLIFLASVGCGAIAIVLAEVVARARHRRRGPGAASRVSGWDRWRSPF